MEVETIWSWKNGQAFLREQGSQWEGTGFREHGAGVPSSDDTHRRRVIRWVAPACEGLECQSYCQNTYGCYGVELFNIEPS